jgi:predicted RNase H-like HicB family nuclease
MVLELKSLGTTSFHMGPIVRDGHAVRAHLAIVKEGDGSFSVIVLNLPGCGSCGETEEDAISNVREAVKEVVESYRADGQEVPWVDAAENDDIPEGAKLKWIMVNV